MRKEICPEDDISRYVDHLKGKKTFNRLFPVPSLAADDPDYNLGGNYWIGSSWPCTTYMILKGLDANGQQELALELAERYVSCVYQVYKETDTIWENNAPESVKRGTWSGPDFRGWAGLGPVAVVREFLNPDL